MNRRSIDADESYSTAQELMTSGRYADAIVMYSSALAQNPDNIVSRVGRGLAFQRIGEHSKAILDFDQVISHQSDWPGLFSAYYCRAVSRYALGMS